MKRLLCHSRRFLLASLATFIPAVAMAELDFSPRADTYELDGISMPQLSFHTGSNKDATYGPPPNWKCTGGRDYLDLQPDRATQAKARISKWPAEPALSFDPEGLAQLKQRILASLPEGSTEVELLSEEQNPLQIDGRQTYLVELNYTYYGERYVCYCLVLDRKPEPISFRLSCRESDYEKLRSDFHRSLFSWQNL